MSTAPNDPSVVHDDLDVGVRVQRGEDAGEVGRARAGRRLGGEPVDVALLQQARHLGSKRGVVHPDLDRVRDEAAAGVHRDGRLRQRGRIVRSSGGLTIGRPCGTSRADTLPLVGGDRLDAADTEDRRRRSADVRMMVGSIITGTP
jgi:hypothetical protein